MKKIKYLITIAILIFLTNCNNILDIEPKDRITGIWENETLVESYVNGMYNSLQHGFCEAMWGSLTDEMHNIHNSGYVWTIQRGELTSDNISNLSTTSFPYFNKWGYAYTSIRDINEFFQQIESSTFDVKIKNRLKGEMKFIRAYLYSELIWRYGDVPLITNVFSLNDDYMSVSRDSYDRIVNFIVNELDDAALLLTQDENIKGRITPDATLALKSRVLLYAASPLNNPSNDLTKWEKAAEAAKSLIDKKYTLYHDYNKLFLVDNDEIIFAKYFTKSINHNINGFSGTNSLYGGGYNNPTENMVMDYEMINGEHPYCLDPSNKIIVNQISGYDPKNPYLNRDPRFYASILYDGCIFQDHQIETFDGGIDSPLSSALPWNATMTGYYLYKFIDPSKSVNLRTDDLSTNPWIFFRYGEILLNYAEAKFELGDEDAARKSINQIRARVNMPPVSSTGIDLRNKIRHERRIELAFEGHRFFDVRRWNILEEVSKKQILGMQIRKTSTGEKSYNIKTVAPVAYYEQHLRLPIPRTEIDKSGGTLIQNDGY